VQLNLRKCSISEFVEEKNTKTLQIFINHHLNIIYKFVVLPNIGLSDEIPSSIPSKTERSGKTKSLMSLPYWILLDGDPICFINVMETEEILY
jgi:hypothetical protein